MDLEIISLPILNFNSIKVQLELNILKVMQSKTKFQFHKGTIRTNIMLRIKFVDVFQFHKGTIRT